MSTIAIIPARGGSRGVPKKNIHLLGGKPLIAWSIETGLACASLDRVIVSTDNDEIADVAKEYGAEVPFMRPAELSKNDTPDYPVFEHALRWLREEEGYECDIVVHLRPTVPLRKSKYIEEAVKILENPEADCVRSVSPVRQHPYWMKRCEDDRLLPFIEGKDESVYYQRQMLPPAYVLNACVDITRSSNVLEKGYLYGGTMFGYIIDDERMVDIDTEFDFVVAELIAKQIQLNSQSS